MRKHRTCALGFSMTRKGAPTWREDMQEGSYPLTLIKVRSVELIAERSGCLDTARHRRYVSLGGALMGGQTI